MISFDKIYNIIRIFFEADRFGHRLRASGGPLPEPMPLLLLLLLVVVVVVVVVVWGGGGGGGGGVVVVSKAAV